jgi:methionyl-tRNA synthetase
VFRHRFTNVQKADSTDNKWYIIPLCKKHNQSTGTLEVSDTYKLVSANKKETKPSVKDISLSVSDVDLRVGIITDVVKHPKADKLFIEKVDLGDDGEIEIVSGLVGQYTIEELIGKHIVVVKNLKPAKLRGVLSYGMLLAAEDSNGLVGLVLVPNAKPGERVRTKKLGPAKDEISFDEFMTLSFIAKGGTVLLNGDKLNGKVTQVLIDKDIKDGTVR